MVVGEVGDCRLPATRSLELELELESTNK
jgi:hypothetical protein